MRPTRHHQLTWTRYNAVNVTSNTTLLYSSPPVDLNTALYSYSTMNDTNSTGNATYASPPVDLDDVARITLYCIIFILATVGNCLVILTLAQNKRMRTVTNVFLLNLAFSDLLLAVFCMPFTLVPMLMRNFVFGATMCVVIRYLQGVCVGVSCFTLVAISMERYFAICHPLRSRSWQTLSHSYKTIVVCWILAGVLMAPTAAFQKLIPLGPVRSKCVERWTDQRGEVAYTIILDVVLLVVPILVMALAYGTIIHTLHQGIRLENSTNNDLRDAVNDCDESIPLAPLSPPRSTPKRQRDVTRSIRQSNSAKSTASKKRVILVLFVIVIEFFVCWTPLYVINTWRFFHWHSAKKHLSPMLQSFVYLLSYISSCCNPITYCFLHKNFRQGFLSVCRCPWSPRKDISRKTTVTESVNSATETTRMRAPDELADD